MAYPLLLHAKHHPTTTYHPMGDWIVPWRFESPDTEYRTLRHGAGLLDCSTYALLEVRGPDRAAFLHNLLTNDIKPLAPGEGCQAALLTAEARLVTDLLVLADADVLWLLCDATRAAALAEALERYCFSEQVTITNHERRQAVLALQGPRTFEALTQVVGHVVALPQPGQHVVVSMNGVSLRVVRQTLTGDVGVLLLCAVSDALTVWEAFRTHGRSSGLGLVGWEALNIARIEAGIPWFGLDMDASNLLPETGLDAATVSETKGCYLGQEIIARMLTYGSANKRLMGLLIEGNRVPEGADQIRREDEVLGRVTSACFSPTLKRPIAMGYLKRGAYEPGTKVSIVHNGTSIPATVTERPFKN